jgi:hypothetical protein
VTLLTAHRILISTAVVFFIFFSVWEVNNFLKAGNSWNLGRAAIYLLVAAGFGVYLKSLKRWYR